MPAAGAAAMPVARARPPGTMPALSEGWNSHATHQPRRQRRAPQPSRNIHGSPLSLNLLKRAVRMATLRHKQGGIMT